MVTEQIYSRTRRLIIEQINTAHYNHRTTIVARKVRDEIWNSVGFEIWNSVEFEIWNVLRREF